MENLSTFESLTVPFSASTRDSHITVDRSNRFLLSVDFNKVDLQKHREDEIRLLEILLSDELYQIKYLNFDHCKGVGECLIRLFAAVESWGRAVNLSRATISTQRALKPADTPPEVLNWLTRFSAVDLTYNGRILTQFVPCLVTSAFELEKCCIASLILDDCPLDYASLEMFCQWLEIPSNQLRKLSVRNCGLGVTGSNGYSLLEVLLRALEEYGQLTYLDLSQNTNVNSYLLLESLSSCSFSSLRELRLEYLQLSDEVR
jgi:hypothetical protein